MVIFGLMFWDINECPVETILMINSLTDCLVRDISDDNIGMLLKIEKLSSLQMSNQCLRFFLCINLEEY